MDIIATISPSTGTNPTTVLRSTYQRPAEVEAATVSAQRADSVEFSAEAAAASAKGASLPYGRLAEQGFDAQKVNRVRAALRDGTYLVPERFTAAISKLRADLDLLP